MTHVRLLVLIALLLALPALAACDAKPGTPDAVLATPGVSPSEIRIGSSLALTGHASYLGVQTLHGALAYINHVNETGGVNGRRITIVATDDGYDPPRCLLNTQQLLIERDIFSLFCYVGTPTTVKILPLIEDAKVPLIGAFTGAAALREPFNRYVVNIRASYYQETDTALRHIVSDLGLKRIGIFYQYDAYGFDGLRGTELALRKLGLAPAMRGSYVRGTLDIEDGLSRLLNAGVDAVVMIGTYEPCAAFINEARARGASPLFYMVSFTGDSETARRIVDPEGAVVLMSQVVPPPDRAGKNATDAVSEFMALYARYFPDDVPGFIALEGFFNAKVLVEGLRRAGRDLTREKFLDAVESIRDFPLGSDIYLNFGPDNHQGLKRVYMTQLQNGRFVPVEDWAVIRGQLSTSVVPPDTDPDRRFADSPAPSGQTGGLVAPTTDHGPPALPESPANILTRAAAEVAGMAPVEPSGNSTPASPVPFSGSPSGR